MWRILKMATRAERLKALLTKTYAENPMTSIQDLRDFAKEAEEDEEEENKVNPTFKEVTEFLSGKERSQVFKDYPPALEWQSRIRKPLKPGVSFARPGLANHLAPEGPTGRQGAEGVQIHALCARPGDAEALR